MAAAPLNYLLGNQQAFRQVPKSNRETIAKWCSHFAAKVIRFSSAPLSTRCATRTCPARIQASKQRQTIHIERFFNPTSVLGFKHMEKYVNYGCDFSHQWRPCLDLWNNALRASGFNFIGLQRQSFPHSFLRLFAVLNRAASLPS